MSTLGDWTGSGFSGVVWGNTLKIRPACVWAVPQLIQWNPIPGAGLHGKHGVDFQKKWIGPIFFDYFLINHKKKVNVDIDALARKCSAPCRRHRVLGGGSVKYRT